MTRKTHPYYDTTRVCSYNAPYNFVVGARGFGKTYGFKKRAIKRNISHGEEFIYLRRYKEEMKLARDSFFNDIREEFPEWEFKIDKGKAWKSPKAVNDDEKTRMGNYGILCHTLNRTIHEIRFISPGTHHHL